MKKIVISLLIISFAYTAFEDFSLKEFINKHSDSFKILMRKSIDILEKSGNLQHIKNMIKANTIEDARLNCARMLPRLLCIFPDSSNSTNDKIDFINILKKLKEYNISLNLK